MMKFLIAIAMVALFGFSLTSAAAVDLGNNDVAREELDDFKENLQSLLSEVSKQIKENVNFKDAADVERFLRENTIDEEQDSIVTTEEEEELVKVGHSDAEDDQSGENVESGISCRWHGMNGKCCQSIRILRLSLTVCLTVEIRLPSIRIGLSVNGRTIWRHTIGGHHTYVIPLHLGIFTVKIKLYNLHITRHYVKVCVAVSLKCLFIHVRRNIGCLTKRFADDEITSAKVEKLPQLLEKGGNINEMNPPPKKLLQLLEKGGNINDLFLVPNQKPTDDVLRFDD